MNSPFVLRQISSEPGSFLARLLATGESADERIAQLFERFLVRRPTPAELSQSREIVSQGGPKAWEDLQWLLVNKVEFLHNY